MIRKSMPSGYDPMGGHRFSLATNAKRLRGDYALKLRESVSAPAAVVAAAAAVVAAAAIAAAAETATADADPDTDRRAGSWLVILARRRAAHHHDIIFRLA